MLHFRFAGVCCNSLFTVLARLVRVLTENEGSHACSTSDQRQLTFQRLRATAHSLKLYAFGSRNLAVTLA